ncbi:MAG: alkaline phosphatase family protein [Solirubrobacteraceae bacterium]
MLVILDGASEPLGVAPTSLERARTPVLDRLAGEGVVGSLRIVPPGLPAGSETAIPGLLGWAPDGPVDRGAVEAAAYGIVIGAGERAWRVDRRDRADAAATARMLAERLPCHRVHHLAGHRMLVLGPGSRPALEADLLLWPGGLIPPRVLGQDTVVIGARGAAIGVARLMGARTIVPPGATGRPGSALSAKAAAALAAIDDPAVSRVVVHVGAPDEAAHDRDADAKVAAIEAADALLLAPLADVLRGRGGRLRVCPDHGCNPVTGEHDDAPVPCLDWPAARVSGGRLTERAAAGRSAEQAVAA